MTLTGSVRDLLEEAKYVAHFPPHEAALVAKNELAARGLGQSGALVQQVCSIYVESVGDVLEAFSEAVLERAAMLGLRGEADLRESLAKAHQEVFDLARGLALDELGGGAADFRSQALAAVDS